MIESIGKQAAAPSHHNTAFILCIRQMVLPLSYKTSMTILPVRIIQKENFFY